MSTTGVAGAAGEIELLCLARIERAYNGLVETARRVADYILQQPSDAVGLSITELAERSGVSDTTVLRFARSLGYRGYRDFSLALAASMTNTPADGGLAVDIGDADDFPVIVQKVFAAEAQALSKAWQTIDTRHLQRAVEALITARSVHCYAVGGSGLLGMEATYRLVRLGLTCLAIYDPIQIAIQAGRLGAGHVAIGFSQTGRTQATVQGLEIARAAGATTIGITSQPHSPLTAASDIALVLLELQTAYRGAYLDSKIAELTLIDALATCIARQVAPQEPARVEQLEADIARMFHHGAAARPRGRRGD